jgi:hypothetical protein
LVANLVVFGMSGKHERKAITDWLVESEVGGHATLESQLATLPIGTAQVWSPRWLKVDGQFKFPLKRTYDAGKTPVRGQATVALKPIDVGALREAMGAIEATAKQNDPKTLQRRVAELEGQLRAVQALKPGKVVDKEIVHALVRDDFKGAEGLMAEVNKAAALMVQAARAASDALDTLERRVPKQPKLQLVGAPLTPSVLAAGAQAVKNDYGRPRDLAVENSDGNGVWPSEFVGKMKDMVIALRSWHPMAMGKRQLALLVGMSAGGGGFNNYLGKLRSLGVVSAAPSGLVLSAFGLALAPPSPPLTPDFIIELWRPQLPAKALGMLQFLRANGSVSKSRLAAGVDMDAGGGGFNNYLGMLRTAGLVEGRGEIRVTELLQ